MYFVLYKENFQAKCFVFQLATHKHNLPNQKLKNIFQFMSMDSLNSLIYMFLNFNFKVFYLKKFLNFYLILKSPVFY
jgi:hypothetical protein